MIHQNASGDGAKSVMQRARGRVVALTLAKHMPALAVVLLPPALWAGVTQIYDLALALAVPAILALGLFAAVWRHPLPDDLRQIEALVTVASLFGIAPLSTLAAFNTLGMPPLDALFEGMSAITTTGLSVARSPDDWPFAAHILRAWMQWCGGLAMATAVLALILNPGLPARQLGRVGMDMGDRIASARQQARQLLSVYAGLTVVMTVLAMLVLPDLGEALAVTLSAVSTAGFSPRSDSLASYSTLGQAVVLLTCILGAVSLLTIVLIAQGKLGEAWRLGSLRRVGTVLAILGSLGVAISAAQNGLAPDLVWNDLANLISGLTTAGFSTGPVPVSGPLVIVFVLAMVMGGDVGSTSGGLKLARLGTLGRAALYAMRVPTLPDSAVMHLRQGGRPVASASLILLLSLILLYVCTAMALWTLFLAHGHPALPALFDTISTLSTVGLSTGVVGPDLSADLKLALVAAMWLGRLEFIAVLVLILPSTWTDRKG